MAKVYKGLYPPGAGYVYSSSAGGWVKAPKGQKGSPAPPKHVATPAPPKPTKSTPAPRADMRSPDTRDAAEQPKRVKVSTKPKPKPLPPASLFQSALPDVEPSRPRPPKPMAVKFVGRPSEAYVAKYGVGWGDVRIDPGGGYVVYAAGPKDYRRAKRQEAISLRQLSEGPSLRPLNEEDVAEQKERQRERAAMSPAERRERDMELAIDLWLQSDDSGAQDVRRSAAATGDVLTKHVRPWLPGYVTGEWVRGERDFDWMVGLDLALMPTLVAGPGEGLLAGGLRASVRPLASARASLFGAKALAKTGSLAAAKTATQASFRGPGYISRGVKAAARGVGAPIRAVRPVASAQAANYAARKAAARDYFTAKATFLNLAAWEKRRMQLIMEQQGQIKIETMMAPFTGGARPLQARAGLERQLGFTGEPAARSAIGRGFEDFIDSNRNLISKLTLGAVRDVEAEAGKRIGRKIQFQRQYTLRPAIALKKAQSRLKSAVDYTALRMIGEATLPADRIAYHIEQAALDPKNALFHEVQAQLVSDASKWIENVNGVPQIAEKAPKRLKQMLALLQESAETRETVLRELGLLSDEVIRGRINAPGAVIHGAKWIENEVLAQHKLLTSPHRAALREFIVGAGIPEGQADAFLRAVGDPAARAHVGVVRANLEKALQQALDDPQSDPARVASIRRLLDNVDDEVDLHYQSLTELFYGQPEDARTFLNDAMEAMGPPEHIDADAIAREILDSGLKLPEHLRDPAVLAQRINLAYEYTKMGEGLGGKDWYDRAAANVQRVTEYINEHPRVQSGKVAPLTEKQVAQVFAILSATDNTVNNVTQVRKALTQWVEHGDVWAGRNPTARSKEVLNVLQGKDWDGRKRNSFYMNIVEDIDPEEYARLLAERGETLEGDPVTVDMWIARIFGEEQPGSNYDAFERVFHRMADTLGWRPKEVQAAAWVGIKNEGIEKMRTEAIEQGKKIPGAYYLLKQAGAADAFEHGIAKSFGQLQLEGLTTSPRAARAFTQLLGRPENGGGGFTLRKNLASAPLKTGYMVAMGAHETKVPTRKMTADAIQGFRDAHAGTLSERNTYVGGWRNDDDGFTYLDISKHFRNRDEAMEYAREQGQLAAFDLKTFEDIPTGLTPEQADEIKVGLRGAITPEIKGATRVPENTLELEAQRAEKDWDNLIQKVIKDQGWRNNQLSREAAHDFLDEYPEAYPGWEGIQLRAKQAREATYPDWARFEEKEKDLVLGFLRPGEGGPFGTRSFTLGLAPHAADIATVTHEWGHFLRFSNFRQSDLRKLSNWAGADLSEPLPAFANREDFLKWANSPEGKKRIQAEEKVARGFEVYVVTGGGKGLKDSDRRALEVLAQHVEANYEVRGPQAKRAVFGHAGLKNAWDDLPAPIRDVYDYFLTHEELSGGQFRLMEGAVAPSAPGQFYVPYKRGLPTSVRHPFRTARALIRMRRTLPVGRGAMGVPDDPTLRTIFKAELLRSGKFDNSQIANASMEQLQRAANLQSIYEVRRALLARDAEGNFVMARVTPERSDDIAVKLNPRKNSDQRLQRIHEYLGQMEAGKKVSLLDLAKEDLDAFERLSQETFGGVLKGTGMGGRSRKMVELGDIETELGNRPARDVAKDILDGVMEPVENIVWVPRRFLDQLGIFEAPRALRSENILSKGAGITADVVNDYLKSSLLYLNPHYYGMNLVGNAVMNLLHEGVFMPLNLSRAFWISHQMGEETAFIDFLMGRGLMSVAELRSLGDIAAGRKISGALGHASGVIVDMIPRRAAFIHEARRAGYRNADAIRELLNDPDALYHVVTKAKRAMVDFDELSPFERDVLTRYVFVYPWLKGATMYTLRFPKEHPVQTAALLWLYQKQQDLADEKIGPRPNYLDLVLPIGTAERYGEKYPLVMNMRQVFTPSTPYEIARNLQQFATGNPNGEALSEMLQPWYGNLLTAVTGWDPFRHQEVPRGLPTFIKSLDPREAPGIQAAQRVLRSEEERQADAEAGRLYPRNRLDDIVQFAFGSIGWSPVNPETARERSQIGPKSAEQKLADWVKEVTELTGDAPDPQMVAIQANKLRYNEVLSEKRRDLNQKDLPDEELTKAKLQVFVELNPNFAAQQAEWEAQIEATPTKDLDKWDDWLGKQLGWEQFSKYQSYLNKWTEYQEGLGGTQP